jgi:plastocyanin
MKRAALALAVAATALAVSASAMGSASVTTLNGTVGPGFTISLKLKGKTVKSLKAGSYKFVIADKSSIHNFRLKGPGVNKDLTSIGFVGTKTVTLKLKAGKYTYYCVPHASSMKGSFTVK